MHMYRKVVSLVSQDDRVSELQDDRVSELHIHSEMIGCQHR